MVAGILTSISFLSQLLDSWKSRLAHDISIRMFSLPAFGVGAWIAHGVIMADVPVILANSLTLLFVAVILALKIRYR